MEHPQGVRMVGTQYLAADLRRLPRQARRLLVAPEDVQCGGQTGEGPQRVGMISTQGPLLTAENSAQEDLTFLQGLTAMMMLASKDRCQVVLGRKRLWVVCSEMPDSGRHQLAKDSLSLIVVPQFSKSVAQSCGTPPLVGRVVIAG